VTKRNAGRLTARVAGEVVLSPEAMTALVGSSFCLQLSIL